jgi:RNA polymerase sigma factor (TIGR02999 family)
LARIENSSRLKAPSAETDVSALLRAWSGGDQGALQALIPIVYEELHRLARHYMRRERSAHSLQATALVNEAYMRLADYTRMQWRDRAHFFAASAQVMRRILVDHARRHNVKRGRGVRQVSIDDVVVVASGDEGDTDLGALDEALVALTRIDPRKAQIVEMRFFGGLTADEIGAVLQVSTGTIKRDWRAAKAWLYHELTRKQNDGRRTLETR